MRHLVALADRGLPQPPASVAEFGPGLSLGTGLAAMLSGADRLHAFDAIAYASVDANLRVFDELVDLFEKRTEIPGPDEFPRVFPTLDSYRFPDAYLTADILREALASERLRVLRTILQGKIDASGRYSIQYVAPYNASVPTTMPQVEMCFSQAVMLYVVDIDTVYRTMAGWLTSGGLMSHTLNFSAVGFADTWDGHWAMTDEQWARSQGGQPYAVSRYPCSAHLRAMEAAGLVIQEVRRETVDSSPSLDRRRLLVAGFDDADFTTPRAFVIAQRP